MGDCHSLSPSVVALMVGVELEELAGSLQGKEGEG